LAGVSVTAENIRRIAAFEDNSDRLGNRVKAALVVTRATGGALAWGGALIPAACRAEEALRMAQPATQTTLQPLLWHSRAC